MSEDYRLLYIGGSPHLDPPSFIPSGIYSVESAGTYNIRNYEFINVSLEDNSISYIHNSDYTTWVLKKDGTLWGCGENEYGNQGSGGTSNITKLTQRLTDVKKFCCSGITTWAIKNDGTFWGCGHSGSGQQGISSTTAVKTFTQRLTDVKDAFCSSDTTWALKEDGTLWGCGNNSYGQQGSGNTTKVTTFTQRLTDVKKVTGSNNTTWAIKADNTLWGCGRNDNGQQGNGNKENTAIKIFVERLENVKDVISTQDTTWALKKDGTLWGCGNNNFGQQGNGERGTNYDVLTFTQRLTNVKKTACSYMTTWALKNDGTLWGCGNGQSGQMGTTVSSDDYYIKELTQRLTDVKDIACSSNTTFAIKNDGTLWACGSNDYGQQGSGTSASNVFIFTQVMENVKKVYCEGYYGNTTVVLKKDDTVWITGRNNYGQQGSDNTTDVKIFTQRITI